MVSINISYQITVSIDISTLLLYYLISFYDLKKIERQKVIKRENVFMSIEIKTSISRPTRINVVVKQPSWLDYIEY